MYKNEEFFNKCKSSYNIIFINENNIIVTITKCHASKM